MARILIVDDEEQDRLFARAILQRAGHDLYFAQNGEEALKAYMRNSIDVVVTDLSMPHVDGAELISVLGDLLPPPPIVVVTGKSADKVDLTKFGAPCVLLSKPIEPKAFLDAVEKAISDPPTAAEPSSAAEEPDDSGPWDG